MSCLKYPTCDTDLSSAALLHLPEGTKDMGVSLSLKGDGQPGCQGTRMVQIIARPACKERIANQL
jgi:hypothetical protein